MSKASVLYFHRKPPEVSGTYQVLSDGSTTSADNYDWVTALSTSAPKCHVFLELEAVAQDIYVRFKSSATAAGTTASNGKLIKAGQPAVRFYVSPSSHRVIDHIATAAGATLKVQVCSPPGERVEI